MLKCMSSAILNIRFRFSFETRSNISVSLTGILKSFHGHQSILKIQKAFNMYDKLLICKVKLKKN